MTCLSSVLQSSVKTVAPVRFSLKAWAAGSSISIAHRLSATPAWCMPSEIPGGAGERGGGASKTSQDEKAKEKEKSE